MSEIARLRAKLAELEHDIVKADMQASIHIDDIKALLNKHVVDNLGEIDIDQAAKTMLQLKEEIHRLRQLQVRKREIERDLAG